MKSACMRVHYPALEEHPSELYESKLFPSDSKRDGATGKGLTRFSTYIMIPSG